LNDKSNKIAVERGMAALSVNISIINFHAFPDTFKKGDNEHIFNVSLRHVMRYLLHDLIVGHDLRSVLSSGDCRGRGPLVETKQW
jgi:hypothetical protein